MIYSVKVWESEEGDRKKTELIVCILEKMNVRRHSPSKRVKWEFVKQQKGRVCDNEMLVMFVTPVVEGTARNNSESHKTESGIWKESQERNRNFTIRIYFKETFIEKYKFYVSIYYAQIKCKVVPTCHVGPEGSRRVKAPSFLDNDTVMVVGCQP